MQKYSVKLHASFIIATIAEGLNSLKFLLQELFRIYTQGLLERDSWESQAAQVDAHVEDEWDNIYVEYSDCENCLSRTKVDARGPGTMLSWTGKRGSPPTPHLPPPDLSEEGMGEFRDRGGESEGDGDSDGDDEDGIMDFAIRGRWSLRYDNNDDDQV